MSNFIGKEYMLAVNSIKFDTVISTFNRLQDTDEYIKTLESIREVGQIEPVYIDNGLLIDGRHRVKALLELGVEHTKAIDINPELPVSKKLTLANKDLISGRQLTKAQLAIQAYKYAELTGVLKHQAAKKFGVGKAQLTSVCEVKKYLPEAYESIIATGKAFIEGKYTQSLQTLHRFINAEIKSKEKDMQNGNITLDYDKLISTEKGKKLFWELYTEEHRPDALLAEHLVSYVNLRFKVVDL